MRAATPSHRPEGLMPEGIKLLPPECFEVEHDGESTKVYSSIRDIFSSFWDKK